VGANGFDRLVLPDYYDQVESGEVFSSDLLSLLDQGKINNIVLLGTNEGSLALSLGLETLGDRFEYYFVGNDADWQDRAPYGSMTVGNPVLDFANAPPTLAAEWRDVVDKWEFETGIDGSDFQITSYEAGSVLFQALQRLLHNERVLPAVDAIRRGLLDLLRNQRFDAFEPYRTIDFSEYGELRTPPAAPVYRLGRGLTREDLTDLQGWVDVDVLPSFNFLESPIRVTLKENGVDSARIVLSRVEDGMPVQIRTQEIQFSGGEAETIFHVFVPGQYRVTVDGVQSSPVNAETQIVLSNAYILSAIAALFGAWIMISRERASIRKRINRIALGVFAGFVLTFSSLYGNEIAGWFPFPSFGDEPTINALLTGLVGGLVGPYVLAEAIVNWILILSVQLDGKRERQVPEGL
jgi:hypothetical protein